MTKKATIELKRKTGAALLLFIAVPYIKCTYTMFASSAVGAHINRPVEDRIFFLYSFMFVPVSCLLF